MLVFHLRIPFIPVQKLQSLKDGHTQLRVSQKISAIVIYFFFFVPKNGKIGDLLRFCIALVIANVECGFFLAFITYEVLKPFLLLNFVHKIGCKFN